MAEITGTPGSKSLAGTSADNSISAFGGDDVIHGGSGLDTVDYVGPITTAKLSTLECAESNTPGDSAGPCPPAHPVIK